MNQDTTKILTNVTATVTSKAVYDHRKFKEKEEEELRHNGREKREVDALKDCLKVSQVSYRHTHTQSKVRGEEQLHFCSLISLCATRTLKCTLNKHSISLQNQLLKAKRRHRQICSQQPQMRQNQLEAVRNLI